MKQKMKRIIDKKVRENGTKDKKSLWDEKCKEEKRKVKRELKNYICFARPCVC